MRCDVLSFATLILRLVVRLLLAALFLLAGTLHLRHPGLFLPIMPPQVPFPTACIVISGVAEILGGIGLLFPSGRVRFWTGWGLALLLVAVFPANIYMAIAQVKILGFPEHAWLAWARLALQPLLIGAVLSVTGAWSGSCDKGLTMQLKPPRP